MPTQPAVLGTARLNNFRLDYLTPGQAATRPAAIWITLGGVAISATSPTRVIHNSMAIRDLVFETPNTCSLTFYGVAPVLGSRLEIWANRNEPALLFGGELQTVERTYTGRPATVLHPCTAIDDTAAANRRRPLGLWTQTSATTIAQWLISTYAPGFSSAGVEANLPLVTVNFDGSEGGMKGCLTQLAKLIGGYWYFEQRTLYLFVTPPGPAPDPINDTPGRFLHDPQIRWSIDKSQVRTRVYGKGASASLAATVDPPTTIVPLEEVTMFTPTGGQAIGAVTPDGAASRVLTYTGVQPGGGGGLVGPGAAPSSAPGLAAIGGVGIESGVHAYAVTFVTAAGESLPSPSAVIFMGVIAAPAAPSEAAPPLAGAGPSPGTHDYAVTYSTAVGETTLGAVAAIATGVTAPPETACTPGAPTAGGSVDTGTHQYAVTFVTAIGETTSGPASAPVETNADLGGRYVTPPTVKPAPYTNPPSTAGTQQWLPGDQIKYQVVFVNAAGTTTPSPMSITITAQQNPNLPAGWCKIIGVLDLQIPTDPAVTGKRLYRFRNGTSAGYHSLANNVGSFEDGGLTAPGAVPGSNTAYVPGTSYQTVPLANIPKGASGSGVTARKVYRLHAGWWYLVTTLANNTATTYTDTTATASLGAAMPGASTAALQQIRLALPPTGLAVVTARRVYRRPPGALAFGLAFATSDPAVTTWTDTIPDASLGAAPPGGNTAAANQVAVTFATGGAGVTGRTLYRTAANAAPLQLLTTIANNTTTTYTDAASDATLGALAPTVDGSGLKQPEGQLVPGASTIPVANTSAFVPSGGWAVVGNGEQAIRYSAVTGTSLTGVPATGVGSLTAAVSYNSTITAAPALVGVAGILELMLQGSPVHVWVQRDDAAAQAYMAGLDGSGDGVYEHIVSDERRSEASLVQACDAELALYSRPLVTVVYASRDTKTKSGKTVAIALTSPAMSESLTIQDVAVSEIGIAPTLKPKFTVTASSVRHSFDAILQMLIKKANA